MPYKVIKTVPSIAELISECTPCCGIGECIGPACKLYQVSKFMDVSCTNLFYSYTGRVIEFFKGDIDIEEIEDSKEPEDSQEPKDLHEPEESNTININLSSSTPNKNASFTTKGTTIVSLSGNNLMVNLKKDKKEHNKTDWLKHEEEYNKTGRNNID